MVKKIKSFFKNSAKNIFIFSLGTGLTLFWIWTEETEAIGYTVNDLEKISEARKITKGKVNYDYLFKTFSLDSNDLKIYLHKIISNSPNNFLLIKFGFDKDKNGNYRNFNIKFSAIDSELNPIPNFEELLIKPNDTFGKNEENNYSNAFNFVKKEDRFYNKVKGHNHEFDKGVYYPITECLNFIKKNKSKRYFFFPALRDSTSLLGFDRSFTTVIITNDSTLRSKWSYMNEITATNESNFYGDKGNGCCP